MAVSDQSLDLVVIRDADDFAPCVDYVWHLFSSNSGWKVRCVETTEAAEQICRQQPCIAVRYGAATETTVADSRLTVSIRRTSFFGPQYLESPDMPSAPGQMKDAATRSGFDALTTMSADGFRLEFDLVASAFWFLTRYEEYIISTPDEHGRFLCEHSMAPAELYDQPVVNLWFENLRNAISRKLGLSSTHYNRLQQHTIVLTHDVDLLRKYRGLRGVRRAVRSIGGSQIGEATEEMRDASLVIAGIKRDPYDSFDDLFLLKERISAPSTFFFMGGHTSGHDCDYALTDMPVRELMVRIGALGDEIAVHPSYNSFRSVEMIKSERAAVASASNRNIVGARQHYLRFTVPETWRAHVAAGLRYDSTMAFADRAGFRCGWSGCMRVFDAEQRVELPLTEIPLVVMDVTLARYEKLAGEHALERLAHCFDACKAPGAAFVLLWHNTLRDARVYPGYWDTFEYFVFAAAGSARFVTLENLCDEFDAARLRVGLH